MKLTSVSDTHLHTIAFSPVLYLAFPLTVISFTPLVLGGVGIRTSTVWEVRVERNKDFNTIWHGSKYKHTTQFSY